MLGWKCLTVINVPADNDRAFDIFLKGFIAEASPRCWRENTPAFSLPKLRENALAYFPQKV
jgi:hypothetical protein